MLFNLVPMHPERTYFTLQNLGTAICPYRVTGIAPLLVDMATLGYAIQDRWELPERALRIPFIRITASTATKASISGTPAADTKTPR